MENIPESNTPAPIDLSPNPFQFSLRTMLIVVTIFCVLLGFLVPEIRSVRDSARRLNLSNDLKQISLGLRWYSNSHNQLPAANVVDSIGKPINSWRFQILPFLSSSGGDAGDFDAAWDAPINARISAESVTWYCFSLRGIDVAPRETQVLAVTGPGTAFEDGKTYNVEELPDDLIIIVETRNSGIHWMEPGDLDIRTMPRTINAPDGRGIAANIGDRFLVAFVDGSVWQISTDVPFEAIEKFLTIDAAKRYDRDEVLGDYTTHK